MGFFEGLFEIACAIGRTISSDDACPKGGSHEKEREVDYPDDNPEGSAGRARVKIRCKKCGKTLR